MPEPETPPSTERSLSRREKEALLQKMYGLPHWIAVIRLFAYNAIPLDEARTRLKPLAEQFGKEPLAAACEELVEIDAQAKAPVASLKGHVRRMAFQILGPEEASAAVNTEPPVPSPQPQTPKKRSAKQEAPDGSARQIRQPRHLVLNRYQAWLNEIGLAFVAVADVGYTTPALKPYVVGLDFILLRDDTKLLVTVYPHLQAKHFKAIAELQKLFGSEYTPVRVWPTEGTDGWNWQEHAIDVSTAEGT